MIKQATGRDSREQVLNVIEGHAIFQETKKQIVRSDSERSLRKQSTKGDTDMNKTLLDKSPKLRKSVTQVAREETLFKSQDEIQELLKIFYNFFVGGRNKPKPSTDDNAMKYYKNKYYQPEIYRQHLAADVNEQLKPATDSSIKSSDSLRNRKNQKLARINESDSEEEEGADEISRDHREIERRISMIQDIDHEYRPSNAAKKAGSVFKKAEQSLLQQEDAKEAFDLNPGMNEAVFGGLNRSLGSLSLRQSAAKKRDSQ